jgi:hypothetical protein
MGFESPNGFDEMGTVFFGCVIVEIGLDDTSSCS